MFKKTLLALAIGSITLSGCSALTAAIDVTGSKAAEASDQALVRAEQVICNAATVGSIERRYNTKEYLDARATLCKRVTRIRTTPSTP